MTGRPADYTPEFKAGYLSYLNEDHSWLSRSKFCDDKCSIIFCSVACNFSWDEYFKENNTELNRGYKKAKEECTHLPPQYRAFKKEDLM